MGERIRTLRYLIRYLRDTDPKYSFEVFIFHIFMAMVCLVLTFIGEFWLWGITTGVLYVSLMIYCLRLRRTIKRRG